MKKIVCVRAGVKGCRGLGGERKRGGDGADKQERREKRERNKTLRHTEGRKYDLAPPLGPLG